MNSDATRKSPQRIGKYAVVERIAAGGMGAVYKAIDVELNQVVALKVLFPDMVENKIILARFRREGASKLRHENIVEIYGYFEDKETGIHYLALEFVDGKDLHDIITRRGKLPAEEAREITIQAARALDHAYKSNIVHRDIKPSNFLITRVNGKMLVKLTDMGLAREVANEEFQLTRPGMTVGTVDYMSPEQARESRQADTRSDLYSLGCTLYHMLAGRAPFAEGSLTERLYKHIEMPPPDIRQFNPDVPEYFIEILHKLLAKKPEDRYQTPAELMADLQNPQRDKVRKPEDTPIPVKKKPARAAATVERKPQATRVKKKPATAESSRPARTRPARPGGLPKWWPIAAGLGGSGVLVLGLVIWALVANNGSVEPVPEPPLPPDPPPIVAVTPKAIEPPVEFKELPVVVAQPEPPVIMGPDEMPYKFLHRTAARIPRAQRQKRWQELAGPFETFIPEAAASSLAALGSSLVGPLIAASALHPERPLHQSFPVAPANAARLHVSRFPGMQANAFRSLADAFAKLPIGQPAIIEIHDNGPLYISVLPELRDQQVWVRGAEGYRPLLTWLNPDKKTPNLFSLRGGRLVLEDLDIVVKWPEGLQNPCFVRAVDGEFQARRCTISMAGETPATLVSMSRSTFEMTGKLLPLRCRLSEIFLRGGNATAVSTNGCPIELLIDRCLLVGGAQPLLNLVGQDTDIHPSVLRLFRSSLIAGNTLIRLQNRPEQGDEPRLLCRSADTVLACNSTRPETTMVQIGQNGKATNLQWHPDNTLYVGWRTLLDSGTKKIPGGGIETFRLSWFYGDADAELPQETWPPDKTPRTSDVPASAFDVHGSPLEFAATSGSGVIGADIGRLPPAPNDWLERTSETYALSPIPLIEPGSTPTIPNPGDGKYHGELINVAQVNLGMLVQQRLNEHKDMLSPRIVLHLIGTGECKTAPFRVRGVKELVIYAEQGEVPFQLVPAENSADQTALVEVEDGNLDLIGVQIRFANSKFALLPNYALRVLNGNLRLLQCRLHGPTTQCPDGFRGLLAFETSAANGTPEKLGINESVIVGARKLITIGGADCQLRVRQSVLAALDEVLHIDAAGVYLNKINVEGIFDHSTVALGKCLASFRWEGEGITLGEPLILQATRSVFVDPFGLQPKKSALLLTDRNTLTRGLVRWQGDSNGYDVKRWSAYMQVADGTACSTLADWEKLWGPASELTPRLLDFPDNKRYVINPDDPDLGNLALPAAVRPVPADEIPGADLVALGILRKKTK